MLSDYQYPHPATTKDWEDEYSLTQEPPFGFHLVLLKKLLLENKPNLLTLVLLTRTPLLKQDLGLIDVCVPKTVNTLKDRG